MYYVLFISCKIHYQNHIICINCNIYCIYEIYLYNVNYITNIGEYDMIFDDEIDKIFKRISHPFINVDELFENAKSNLGSGPYYYGYTLMIGPNGKPVIKEYGNAKPGLLLTSNMKEPLIDKIVNNNVIKLVTEMPGLDKKDIKITIEENKIQIKGEKGEKKYYVETKLDDNVDQNSITAKYTNGILEIKFNLIKKQTKNKNIEIQ